MTFHAKMEMSDLLRYPWHLNLIKNGGKLVVFISVSFSNVCYNQEMRKPHSQRNRKKRKTIYSYLIRQGFQDSRVLFSWRVTWIYAYNPFNRWKPCFNPFTSIISMSTLDVFCAETRSIDNFPTIFYSGLIIRSNCLNQNKPNIFISNTNKSISPFKNVLKVLG